MSKNFMRYHRVGQKSMHVKIDKSVSRLLKEEEELLQYNSNSPFMDENSIFRQELERFRVVETDDDDDDRVEIRAATEEFIEKIKTDSEDAPTIEDTFPEEESKE